MNYKNKNPAIIINTSMVSIKKIKEIALLLPRNQNRLQGKMRNTYAGKHAKMDGIYEKIIYFPEIDAGGAKKNEARCQKIRKKKNLQEILDKAS